MTPFEEELRKALIRRDAPEGFTARVLAATREQESKRESSAVVSSLLQWFRSVRLVPAVATLAVITAGGLAYRQHEREARGEAAKQQLLLAMQIAGSKLHGAQLIIKEVEQ